MLAGQKGDCKFAQNFKSRCISNEREKSCRKNYPLNILFLPPKKALENRKGYSLNVD